MSAIGGENGEVGHVGARSELDQDAGECKSEDRAGHRRVAGILVARRLDDILGDLGVAEEHHGVVAEEQLVLDACITGSHAALDEEHGACIPDVENRHAVDRRIFNLPKRGGLG